MPPVFHARICSYTISRFLVSSLFFFLNPLSPYRNQVKCFLFHKMSPQSTEVCMDTKRSFFSRHVYGRSWGFTHQTLNDTIFCMPRTCAPAVDGSAWALSMSSSKSVCACAESRACRAACWTVYRNIIFVRGFAPN